MSGTVWLMYQALPYVKDKRLYSDLFNKFSISYYSFLVVCALLKYMLILIFHVFFFFTFLKTILLFVTGNSDVLPVSLAEVVSPFVQTKEAKTQEKGDKEAIRGDF